MLMRREREAIAEYGRKMLQSRMTRNTGGYLSVYDREGGTIAVCPGGMDYMSIRPEDVIVVNISGERIEGDKRLSSEWGVQQLVYANREDVNALVHTHSPFATTLSALRWEVPAANFTMARAGGSVRCTEFHNYTTEALARDILDKMSGRNAVLMGNHGLLTCGKDLADAYVTAEEVEFGCEVYWRARYVGQPVLLSGEQMDDMVRELGRYYSPQGK